MGFYIRKAIRVGPFRFNLSKSGVGVSAGVKGLRLGTGPRGNYVHMGRGGLYYRKTLPSGIGNHNQTPVTPSFRAPRNSELPQEHTEIGHDPLEEIKSVHVTQMVDSSSASLVEELNEKSKKLPIWPSVAILGTVLALMAFIKLQAPMFALFLAILTVACTVLAVVKDSLRKTTVLFFDLEPEIEELYQKLHDVFLQISSSSSIWRIEAEGAIYDQKRNAGASSVLKRTLISLGIGSPAYFKTNLPVPRIPLGEQTLYFLPDKVLMFGPGGVGAVSYPNLQVSVVNMRFIERDKVPQDAQVVDRTWEYVNKQGGPDRRFNDNFEIPVVLYEDIIFTSDTGLNERIEISKIGFGEEFSRVIRMLASNI